MKITMRELMAEKVEDNLEVEFEGVNRATGNTKVATVGFLLSEAQERDGVYGDSNKRVSGEMMVADLLNWHSDWNWSLNN